MLPLPEKGSNRGFDPSQILECFWTSIWIGAGRFSHSAYLRYDDVLKQIFEWKRIMEVGRKEFQDMVH